MSEGHQRSLADWLARMAARSPVKNIDSYQFVAA
jgi:hypothetical protein